MQKVFNSYNLIVLDKADDRIGIDSDATNGVR